MVLWFLLSYLTPQQLSNSHEEAPQPLLHIERGTTEGLAPKLHNHNLHTDQQQINMESQKGFLYFTLFLGEDI